MANKTPSVALVLFFSYLCISVCFSAPLDATFGNFAPIIGTLPIVNQLFLAALLDIDASVDLSITGFSSSVIDTIKGATSVAVVANVAASVSLLNLINICVKLNALIKVNPSLFNIITAKADAYVSVLDGFFKAVNPVSATANAILDVRTLPNFASALAAAGVSFIPAIINFALCISLSLIFNQVFCQILNALVPALGAVVAQVLILVDQLLITVSALLTPILITVVGLLGGILNTVALLLNGLLFPTLFQVVGVVFPTINGLLSQGLLNQLTPFSSLIYSIPSSSLVPASNLFTLLNSAR